MENNKELAQQAQQMTELQNALSNMSDEQINEAFDKMMKTAEEIIVDGNSEADMIKKHQELVKEITGVQIAAVGDGRPAVQRAMDAIKDGNNAPIAPMAYEQVEQVAKKMEECVEDDKTTQFVKNLPSNNGQLTRSMDEKAEDIDPSVALTTTNPESGAAIIHGIVGEDFEEKDIDFDFDKYLNMDDYSLENLEFTKEVFTDDILDTFKIKKNEVDQLVSVINRVKSKEEFNVYKELPSSIKILVDNLVSLGGASPENYISTRNAAAKDIINSIAVEVGSDKYQYDLEAILHKQMQTTTSNVVQEAYTDLIISKKKQMYDTAAKVEEIDAEKAAKLRAIGDACEESYKLDKFYDAIKNHKLRIKKYDIERPDKVYRNFCCKYEESAMCINQISDITIAIPRHLNSTEKAIPEVTGKTITALAVAFCKYCQNMSPNVPEEHAFMYYFIKNILALDVTVPGEECIEFDMQLIDRIKDLLNAIVEVYGIK